MVHYVGQPWSDTSMPVERFTYVGIANDLAARIAAGEYPIDTKLPSSSELEKIYSVGHSTVVRAMGILRDRGLVYGIQGVGTFVADTPTARRQPPTGGLAT